MIIKDFIFVNVDFWSSELQTTLKIHTYIYIYPYEHIYILNGMIFKPISHRNAMTSH